MVCVRPKTRVTKDKGNVTKLTEYKQVTKLSETYQVGHINSTERLTVVPGVPVEKEEKTRKGDTSLVTSSFYKR